MAKPRHKRPKPSKRPRFGQLDPYDPSTAVPGAVQLPPRPGRPQEPRPAEADGHDNTASAPMYRYIGRFARHLVPDAFRTRLAGWFQGLRGATENGNGQPQNRQAAAGAGAANDGASTPEHHHRIFARLLPFLARLVARSPQGQHNSQPVPPDSPRLEHNDTPSQAGNIEQTSPDAQSNPRSSSESEYFDALSHAGSIGDAQSSPQPSPESEYFGDLFRLGSVDDTSTTPEHNEPASQNQDGAQIDPSVTHDGDQQAADAPGAVPGLQPPNQPVVPAQAPAELSELRSERLQREYAARIWANTESRPVRPPPPLEMTNTFSALSPNERL